MTPAKVSGTLSNRHEGPLQSPACYALNEFGNFNGYSVFWFRAFSLVRNGADICVGFDRVLEKPIHLSKEARFRKNRRAERRNARRAVKAPAVRDPEA